MLRIPKIGRKGSVSVVGALVLPLLIGMTGLVAEYGNGVLAKTQDQRLADLAAYAGAVAYNSTSSTTTMTSVIDNVASLNGVPAADVTGALVSSPTGDGNQAVQVTVNTTVPLIISRILNTGTTLPVTSVAYAELKANATGCVIALNSSGTGVTLSGGTAITADACAVASNNTVSVPCGDTITTVDVDYDSSGAPSQPCNGIQAPSGSSVKILKTVTSDPLAGNSGVSAATSRLSTVAAMSSPAFTAVPTGGAINFAYSTASFSGSTWTLTCPSGGAYNFGAITTGGGITVNFNTSGSASTTYNFSGSIDNTGTAMTFGPGTYNIAQGIVTGGGTTTTFGAGVYNIGPGSSSCSGATYSICNTGTTLVFGGPSTFVISGGIYNSGGSSLTLGSGSSNSFDIGASSNGNAFYAGGGSTTVFGNATGASDVFDLVGNLNISSGGGSCLTLPAAAEHDINGYFSTAGGTILGAGVYTVHGYIALGANGGGDVTCSGTDVGMDGNGVTLVTDGSTTPSSGTCAGEAFCLAAGYSNVTLTAPTSGTTANLAVIGPISASNTAGAAFAEGASNTSISGAFYIPNGAITLSGGSSIGGGVGQCLEIIGSQVTLSGGTAAASTCISAAGSSSSSVILVQ
jgi:hypothetical protein